MDQMPNSLYYSFIMLCVIALALLSLYILFTVLLKMLSRANNDTVTNTQKLLKTIERQEQVNAEGKAILSALMAHSAKQTTAHKLSPFVPSGKGFMSDYVAHIDAQMAEEEKQRVSKALEEERARREGFARRNSDQTTNDKSRNVP